MALLSVEEYLDKLSKKQVWSRGQLRLADWLMRMMESRDWSSPVRCSRRDVRATDSVRMTGP